MLKRSMVVLIVLLCLSISVPAMAAINVNVDGKELVFDVQPTIVSDRTMVPMRAIFEALGATVEWNADKKEVTAKYKDEFDSENTLVLTINKTNAFSYGYRGIGEEITMDVPPMIINDRTMVPTRFVAESLGATVNWIEETRTVQIISPSGITPITPANPASEQPPAVTARPEMTFELTTGEYQGTDFVAEGVFTNTGNVKISRVDKVSVKVYMHNDEGQSVLLDEGNFEDLDVNLAPGQSDVYTFIFPDVTFYEDATSWTSEGYEWEFTWEQ